MNYEQVSTFLFVLGSISSVDLVYFIKLTRSDTIFWTYSNTQLFLIIVGYLGYVLSTALVYNYVTVLMVAQTEIKVAYSISFLFVALAECAYLQHSWSTVKTVMNFKNKARCTASSLSISTSGSRPSAR